MAFRYEMTAPGVENVVRATANVQPPEADQVRLHLSASSLNFHDWVTLSGFIPWVEYPRVPLSDGCGVVDQLGGSAGLFSVGDRVLTAFYPHWLSGRPSANVRRDILGETVDGCLQEYLCLNEHSLALAPSHMTDVEAATLPCAGLTAWSALVEEGRLTAGQTVLVQGTGGVALAGLQIAKAMGAQVVLTSSSDEKLEKARALGADVLINYRRYPEWEKQVLDATGGVDLVVETGGQETLSRSVACTRHDGFIAIIGVLTGHEYARVSITAVMQKNIGIKGITVGSVESLDRYCRFTERHQIRPVVSHVFDAGELAGALAVMAQGQHFGKVGITIGAS